MPNDHENSEPPANCVRCGDLLGDGVEAVECARCGGSGLKDSYSYALRMYWPERCFMCDGTGRIASNGTTSAATRREKTQPHNKYGNRN